MAPPDWLRNRDDAGPIDSIVVESVCFPGVAALTGGLAARTDVAGQHGHAPPQSASGLDIPGEL